MNHLAGRKKPSAEDSGARAAPRRLARRRGKTEEERVVTARSPYAGLLTRATGGQIDRRVPKSQALSIAKARTIDRKASSLEAWSMGGAYGGCKTICGRTAR